MSVRSNVLLLVSLAAAGGAAYLLASGNSSGVRTNIVQPTREIAANNEVTGTPEQIAPAMPAEHSLELTPNNQDETGDCITPAQLQSDPVLAAEYARLDSVITSGPTIASYRGLTAGQLGDLAIQGDSAAMAVLGAVSVMRARRLSDDKAVSYLLREDPGLWSFSLAQPLEPDVVRHLEEARDWFYRSALHGRLMALRNAGEMIAILAGTPTRLGWIDESEYESLEATERFALDPATVYEALAFEIAPQLRSGPFGEANAELTAGGPRQQAILDQLVSQFNEKREAAKLPPINIPESAAPSVEQLEAALCNSYWDSVS